MPHVEDLVTVIIPAYNAERFIGRTLASVLRQSHRAIDVVVVDDGSTDGTAALVAAAAARDARVRLVTGPNRGVAAARNRAIAEAKGDLVAPVDADDLWHPEKLALQVAALARAPRAVGVVYCWSAGIDENDDVVYPSWSRSEAAGNVLETMVVEGVVGNGSAPLMRRALVEAVGGYDSAAQPAEDYKLYLALAGICEFAVVPDYLVGYRLLEVSHSAKVAAMEAALVRIGQWIAATWPDLPPHLLRWRECNINLYLSFLALRQGNTGAALRYRARAYAARPGRIATRESVSFMARLLFRAAGGRHVHSVTAKPVPFPGAGASAPAAEEPAHLHA